MEGVYTEGVGVEFPAKEFVKRYKVFLLDFDGTLASTVEDVVQCVSDTFRSLAFSPPQKEQVLATMGLSLEEGLRRLLPESARTLNLAECVRLYRRLYASQESRARLFPGVADFLEHAHVNGARLIVVSNKGERAIHTALRRLEIFRYVSMVVAGDMALHNKPDAALYRCDIQPRVQHCVDEEVLIIGDTETDLQFANNCGLDSCWVSYGYGDREKCLACAPKYVADSLCRLLPMISGNKGRRRGGQARRGRDRCDWREL